MAVLFLEGKVQPKACRGAPGRTLPCAIPIIAPIFPRPSSTKRDKQVSTSTPWQPTPWNTHAITYSVHCCLIPSAPAFPPFPWAPPLASPTAPAAELRSEPAAASLEPFVGLVGQRGASR